MKDTLIHVLLLAQEKDSFLEQLNRFKTYFEELIQEQCTFPYHFCLYQPVHAPSFGSTNQGIFQEIGRLAKQEGFLTDPIYSAKLFIETRRILHEKNLKGNVLIQHSGGALTLAGFQNQLYRSEFEN